MPNVTQVNDWQWNAAKGITEGRSQIVLSATGSGKSMVWTLLLLAMKRRGGRGRGMGGNGSALDRQERRIVPEWRGKERIPSRRSIFALCGNKKSRPRMRSTDMSSIMKRAVGMTIWYPSLVGKCMSTRR